MSVWRSCRPIATAGLGVLMLMTMTEPTAAAESAPEVVARLGETEFTAASLADFVRSLEPNVRKQALADPQLLKRLVGLEMARIAVLNEAKNKNWQQRPDVARQIERARDATIVATYLSSVGAVPANYPSEAEIKAAYDMNRDSFMIPRQYRLEQIFVAAPSTVDKRAADVAAKKAADMANIAKAKNANFGDLARAHSDHKPSAEKRGDLGWASQNDIMPEILTQIAGMTRGEISDPIRTNAGWHIVKLIDTKPAAPRPLAEVKDSLVASLRQRKLQDNQQAYIAFMLDKNPATVNDALLRKLFESTP
jgi:parvulin-like peptidyl-prolyl isomerase